MKIGNWGNYPVVDATVHEFREPAECAARLGADAPLIARGMGRSYGDASLGQTVLSALPASRLLAFDETNGELHCEAGVRFDTLIDVFLPRGWFLPVTPGTKFITVGGALAADIHGKNHHVEGSFANHVQEITILTADGTIRTCGPSQERDLFEATAGGMGLTGVILSVRFRLKRVASAYIRRTTVRARNLAELTGLIEEHADATYSVAWLDCLAKGKRLGRGALFLGEHAVDVPAKYAKKPLELPRKRSKTVPFNFPGFVLNETSVHTFNTFYYGLQPKKPRVDIIDLDTFFYPLDAIHDWNRIYGRQGFVQYQFVLPKAAGLGALRDIIAQIAKAGTGSFLAVLKLFGAGNGWMSFPMEGYTLALDFPVHKKVFKLLDALDEQVAAAGGRIYLAKDARMKPSMLRSGYPELDRFLAIKRRFDPKNQFESALSSRLEMT